MFSFLGELFGWAFDTGGYPGLLWRVAKIAAEYINPGAAELKNLKEYWSAPIEKSDANCQPKIMGN